MGNAPSHLLQSDEFIARHTMPLRQQAMEAEAQAYAQTPQLAIQSFLQMRQANERARENAAHVALEQAQTQEYVQRSQMFGVELQIRQQLAATQIAEIQARTAREQSKADYEPFNNTGMSLGEVVDVGGGKYIKYLPGRNGPRETDASDDEIKRYKRASDLKAEDTESRIAERDSRVSRRGASAGAAGASPEIASALGDQGWRTQALSPEANKKLDELNKEFGDVEVAAYLSGVANALSGKIEGLDGRLTLKQLLEVIATNPEELEFAKKAIGRRMTRAPR